ncbi:2-dehydro-3-deoxy-6-phosphogalactonate aldolase [Massilia antarctica]|uniref:2-dehydro-3-deoxy-6-phosphogalactonate aldolase n=1 Tax=Massilia antarctica TaxID=2765360 RepID=UPI0006BB5F88|nr:2-dehydro-3-deoxy-6-phosphogalactonate aldolase [Massilia sp. H27-R4]MCY0910477.1 2-dehydro-3-deoxy-6-phosphogalactonate aldolase [Massilia sp. H27-R4]CUI09169.1 2-dehydro-3-deoxyphosphogalactonate aldolase [Janthinobacterium sp. CG23_2]CUU32955.1 2-dehydro-3-deoxyphosphogalactonate aldolase [Janthinobacterium sp. CG23_2]
MDLTQLNPPLVAILRGLQAHDAETAGAALFEAGFRLLEVPLNRPGALESIALLARMAPAGAIVGGGTMLKVADVDAVHAAGGRMLVAPNCNTQVIARAQALGMLCAPGVATPSEAFDALGAGAHALKIFPAEMVGYTGLKAFKTVLPPGTPLWPVGGVAPDTMAAWVAAGATGFGIGGALYTPGVTPQELGARAAAFVAAWRATQAG